VDQHFGLLILSDAACYVDRLALRIYNAGCAVCPGTLNSSTIRMRDYMLIAFIGHFCTF